MGGFTKLFSTITTSTVWMEPDQTRIVWVAMMAMCDQYGRVMASIPGLAHIARVPVEATREAIDRFMAPDPDSRTPDFDGRRIEKIEGGWRLLNYERYREARSADERREYLRNKKREERDRKRQQKRQQVSTDVAQGQHSQPRSTKAEAEAEAELTEDSLRSSSSSELRDAHSEPENPPKLKGTLPLNDGTDFPITDDQVSEWKALYPAVDVMQQLRHMKGWLSAHQSRRKTRKGILKFIHSWLSREQDKGRNVPDAATQRSSGASQRVSANQ